MGLKFTALPWKENEKTKYRIRMRNEEGEMEEIGKMEFELSGIKSEDKIKFINIRSTTQLFTMDFIEELKLKINADTFRPIIYESSLSTPQGDINVKGEYSRRNVKIFSLSPQGKANHKIPISGEIYDNSEIIHIFRALDFENLSKTDFRIFNVLTAQQISASVELIGEEEIEVPAGKFECYRIKLELCDLPQEMKQYFLYNRCEPKLFVKSIAGEQVVELVNYNFKNA